MSAKSMIFELAILAFVAVGCGDAKTKKAEGSNVESSELNAPPLSSADLAAPAASTNETDFSEVLDDLENESFFYDKKPKEEDAKFDACMDKQLSFVKIKVSESKFQYGFTTSLKDCMQYADVESSGTSSIVYESVVMSYFYEFACSGSDFSKLDGKTVAEAKRENLFSFGCEGAFNLLENTYTKADVSYSGKEGSSRFTLEVKDVNSNVDGSKCSGTASNGEAKLSDGCSRIHKEIFSNVVVDGISREALPSYRLYTKKGIINKKAETIWLDAGTIDVLHDGWRGTVTYSNGDTNPKYSLKAPGSAVAKTGTLTPKSKRANLQLKAKTELKQHVAPIMKFRSFGPNF